MSFRIWQRIDITQDEWGQINQAAAMEHFPVDFEWRVGGYTALIWRYGDSIPRAIEYLISLRTEEFENQKKGI